MIPIGHNVFKEWGFDTDNNRWGFGYSVEVETADGAEFWIKDSVPIRDVRYYVRIWVGKRVLIVDRNGFRVDLKMRNLFKIIFGISGVNDDYL